MMEVRSVVRRPPHQRWIIEQEHSKSRPLLDRIKRLPKHLSIKATLSSNVSYHIGRRQLRSWQHPLTGASLDVAKLPSFQLGRGDNDVLQPECPLNSLFDCKSHMCNCHDTIQAFLHLPTSAIIYPLPRHPKESIPLKVYNY